MSRILLQSTSVIAVSLVAAFAGCSSSNGNNSSGSSTDGGGSDVAAHKDSGGSSSGGDSGGSSSGGDSGDDGGGGTCPDNTAFTPVTYAPVTAHKGVCKAADITAFVTACGDNGSQTTCDAWQSANSSPDASTACGQCILDPNNAGASWVDQMGFFGPNYAGCIQLTDTTNGSACAAAFDAANDCHGFECDSCAAGAFATCVTTVNTGICKQYADTEKTACTADLADGGALSTCSPGAATGKQDPDFTYIATLICGSADGG
jgi:hypothetical protein